MGKTEPAKAVAAFLFDDPDALVRLDMSAYQERHTVSRLVGAPPGYLGYDEGSERTELVRLAERGITLTLTEAAKQALVAEGYDPVYGARPLRRVIQRRVENPVSHKVLAGEFTEGDTVLVDHTGESYTFTKAEVAAEAA